LLQFWTRASLIVERNSSQPGTDLPEKRASRRERGRIVVLLGASYMKARNHKLTAELSHRSVFGRHNCRRVRPEERVEKSGSRFARLSSGCAKAPKPILLAGGALAFVALGGDAWAFSPPGPAAAHMAEHIFLMNALAPAFAALAVVIWARRAGIFASGRVLIAATTIQITLLWVWHAPFVLPLALSKPPMHLLMQTSLMAASTSFWFAVFSECGAARWRGVLALALTGKLSCLLGVLLLLAPRVLYSDFASDEFGFTGADALLADQRIAGLLMLMACPLTYVLGGTVIAAKWLRDLEKVDAGRRAFAGRSTASAAST
jgi:putative membrane protein